MTSTKTISNMRSSVPTHSLLPPKCPIPVIAPFCGDYGFLGSRGMPKPRDSQKCHQRTSSESFLIDEQPSWLDDLLNEPEIHMSRGAHRRSSSDCFPYIDASILHSNVDILAQEDCRQLRMPAITPWAPQEFNAFSLANRVPCLRDAPLTGIPQNRRWEIATMNNASFPHNLPLVKDNTIACYASANASFVISDVAESKEQQEQNQDNFHAKQSDLDPKRAKQQFAQRSRVKKLQYIAELERNVQVLHAQGLEFAAELDFLNKQNLILSLENKSLKQRFDSLAQEQLIKRFQQEMLEGEISRLQILYQQQRQPHMHTNPTHGRSGSRDLDTQFASLSLKQKDPNSGPVRS